MILSADLLAALVAFAFVSSITPGPNNLMLLGSMVIMASRVADRPAPPRTEGDSAWIRIAEGIAYVRGDQVLLGSMALDLFAIFFGGVAALLPAFATDVLHVGPTGLGVMHAAISVGALASMLVLLRHPPRARGPAWGCCWRWPGSAWPFWCSPFPAATRCRSRPWR